ncbi:MAG: tRNA (adenosine(37)-N6)-threonylcarbamoyltransferase complex transferase subunit TsaD [Chlamydiales bacterium]|nr:tRNA (adenosine(37)-N6)-threonylcarbamoyltransferase complex transferase subunit TsaD [Chlamydiales bacterium]
MKVLGIETTCDETSCAIVEDGQRILAHKIYSQFDLHCQFNGVFPELASRRHLDVLIPVLRETMEEAKLSPKEIDLIAVAKGPGLIGALLVGLNAAKTLSLAWEIPFIGVNHVEAHLYASMMGGAERLFPALGVVISGGHTFLVKIDGVGSYQLIGTTQDDAIGEAFDKVATLIGLPYPGGPVIEALARSGDPHRYPFKPGKVKEGPLDFSFSGLKTSVLYAVKGANSNKDSPICISEEEKPHIAASFQEAALGDIVQKALAAARQFDCRAIYVGGGVSNNKRLREMFTERSSGIPLFWPAPGLSLDNAAMIAGLGFHTLQKKGCGDALDLEAQPRIPLN